MEASIDISAVQKAMAGLEDKEFRSAVRSAIRRSLVIVRKSIQTRVKLHYPGGRRKNSGMLRGKQYGPLYKDVRLSVWKKQAKGGSVALLGSKSTPRACVLRWLEESRGERFTKPIIGEKQSRGALVNVTKFFEPGAAEAMPRAAEELNRNILAEIQKKWNKH